METIDSLYKEFILDLYRNPLNQDIPNDHDIEIRGHNPSCGDDFTLYIKLSDGNIDSIAFRGEGCAISTAAFSLITDEVKGKSKDEVHAISEPQMIGLLGIRISHTRSKCAHLGLRTIQQAMK